MKADPSRAERQPHESSPEDHGRLRRRPPPASPDPEEITVPFDPESCGLPLISQKEWADSYAHMRSAQRLPAPPLSPWTALDQIEPMSGSGIGIAGLASAFVTLIELAIMAWTAFLLLFGFPLPQVLLLVAAAAWAVVLILLGLVRRRRAAWRVFVWFGGAALTLWWYLWSPRSAEMIALLRRYFDFLLK